MAKPVSMQVEPPKPKRAKTITMQIERPPKSKTRVVGIGIIDKRGAKPRLVKIKVTDLPPKSKSVKIKVEHKTERIRRRPQRLWRRTRMASQLWMSAANQSSPPSTLACMHCGTVH